MTQKSVSDLRVKILDASCRPDKTGKHLGKENMAGKNSPPAASELQL